MNRLTIPRNRVAFVMNCAGAVMAMLYIFSGLFIIVRGSSLNVSPSYVLSLGSILIIYGMFRGFRSVSTLFNKEKHYEDDGNK